MPRFSVLFPSPRFWVRLLLLFILCFSCFGLFSRSAEAAVDPYVTRYLRVKEAVSLPLNHQGQTQPFSADQLSDGKRFFSRNCLNCHVGGTTLPNPPVSLSLDALKGATPPRDTIESLVDFFRRPMTYDGSEASYWCREVAETWLAKDQAESLAAFLLKAAEVAPAWGTETFQGEF